MYVFKRTFKTCPPRKLCPRNDPSRQSWILPGSRAPKTVRFLGLGAESFSRKYCGHILAAVAWVGFPGHTKCLPHYDKLMTWVIYRFVGKIDPRPLTYWNCMLVYCFLAWSIPPTSRTHNRRVQSCVERARQHTWRWAKTSEWRGNTLRQANNSVARLSYWVLPYKLRILTQKIWKVFGGPRRI